MSDASHITPIEGVIQEYAWGGKAFLAQLLHREKSPETPWAEYWLGAHPKGAAKLPGGGKLSEYIAQAPVEALGTSVARAFGSRLPFLLKVLDVDAMLSIQVHPTKAAAEEGFAREEQSGPERTAPNRNYRDDNHKPELGVALTDFYLLHGFRAAEAIRESLDGHPEWQSLLPVLDRDGVRGVYEYIMKAPQGEINTLLQPTVDRLLSAKQDDLLHPDYWARRAIEQYSRDGNHDRGMFSIYWFNLVRLQPGEGIFQDAGIPHAYLQGACVELMANSDNVLRGGLTPKHIDVPELLRHTICDRVVPEILAPRPTEDGWEHYPTPAPDFALLRRSFGEEVVRVPSTDKPSILLLLDGELADEDGRTLLHQDQRAFFVPPGNGLHLRAVAPGTLYRATVGES
ncbi:mannose-6-phosphate isomerase, class I [Lewinella sp. W8]|uniref:mannose-6-phosphate isomerase, class I n=1 Tax=Lewinella sp. W8 TaxID=2528208 RepID=UPI0010674123|nr:mannose-6-phosphate isomerase, class I [Lewinella sp. W8]MTB50865.1 mannose-6-phosphate isomerase, class I [Lewinella sp. W8]